MAAAQRQTSPAQTWRGVALATAGIFLLVAGGELAMGRLLLGPDGRFGWWEGNIWSKENSQRFADPYSFSHITHGILFFGFFWLVARRVRLPYRFLMALVLEASWEILENSPLIIERYRHTTIAIGYRGDSVLNSMSDILMMCLGFLLAARLPVWACVAAILVMEIGCAVVIRDNLTLNIIMLIHPFAAIKAWQAAGAPPGS